MLKIGNVESKNGTVQKGVFRVGSYADGSPIALPIMVAAGKTDGPVLWVEGCVHGEEYGGAASIIRFVESLDVDALKGTLVAMPVANPPSYLARKRISGIDGANLNRIFPGNTTGTYSHHLAYALIEAITKHADYFMDLHSGGIFAEVPFYAIYDDNGSEAAKRSRKIAKSLGVNVVWRQKGEAGLGGAISAQTTARGIPSVTVEVGGGTVTAEHLSQYDTAIRNMLIVAGMLDGETPKFDEYTIVSDGVFMFNHEGGMFVPDCKPGAHLKKGDKIGHIINLYGETVEQLINPWEHGYISAIRHNYAPTDAGELVAESMSVEGVEAFDN